MSKFVLTSKLDLSELSPEWKDCYIELRDLTVGEIETLIGAVAKTKDGSKEQIDALRAILEKCFVSGRGYNGKEVVDMAKEDIADLPLRIYRKSFDFLAARV